jgi:hypothetical protein
MSFTHCVGRSRSLKLNGSRTELNPSSFSLYTTVAKSAAIHVELPTSSPSTMVFPFCSSSSTRRQTCRQLGVRCCAYTCACCSRSKLSG